MESHNPFKSESSHKAVTLALALAEGPASFRRCDDA